MYIVVQGGGQLTADMPSIVLQPMERGIIRELKVKVGDTVKKGQVLAALDPTFIQADMAALSAQELSLSAQLRRIEAEVKGVAFEAAVSPRFHSPISTAWPIPPWPTLTMRCRRRFTASAGRNMPRVWRPSFESSAGRPISRRWKAARLPGAAATITRDGSHARHCCNRRRVEAAISGSQSMRLRAERVAG
jgi:predicted deacylase